MTCPGSNLLRWPTGGRTRRYRNDATLTRVFSLYFEFITFLKKRCSHRNDAEPKTYKPAKPKTKYTNPITNAGHYSASSPKTAMIYQASRGSQPERWTSALHERDSPKAIPYLLLLFSIFIIFLSHLFSICVCFWFCIIALFTVSATVRFPLCNGFARVLFCLP